LQIFIYCKATLHVSGVTTPIIRSTCRYLFTAKLLYMFRVSQHPSSGVVADIYLLQATLHVSGVTAPIIRSTCRYLFTAKLLYMFRVSQHPSSEVLKTVAAACGAGHNTCTTATPLQLRPDQTALEGSSGTSIMTCTGGCGYSF